MTRRRRPEFDPENPNIDRLSISPPMRVVSEFDDWNDDRYFDLEDFDELDELASLENLDDAEEDRDERSPEEVKELARLAAFNLVSAGGVSPPPLRPRSRSEALHTVSREQPEFLWIKSDVSHRGVLLARSVPDGPVGPRLTAAIHSAITSYNLDVSRWRSVPLRYGSRRYESLFLVESVDGASLDSQAIREAVGRGARSGEDAAPTVPEVAQVETSEPPAPSIALADSQVAILNEQLDIQAREATSTIKRLREEMGFLRARLSETLNVLSVSGRSRDETRALRERLASVEKALLQAEVDRDVALQLAEDAQTEGHMRGLQEAERKYQDRLKADAGRIAHYQHLVTDLERNRTGIRRADGGPITRATEHSGPAFGLDDLLTDVAFWQGSDARLSEFDMRRWMLALQLLCEDRQVLGEWLAKRHGKIVKCRGNADWEEIRLDQRHSNLERAYFTDRITSNRREAAGSDCRWLVYLHLKKDDTEQSRVIARLP